MLTKLFIVTLFLFYREFMDQQTHKGKVVVVGAGVSGLTAALELKNNGFEVVVMSKDDSLRTNSAMAGAIWWPYDLEPTLRARPWAKAAFSEFQRLAVDAPESGVRLRSGRYFDQTITSRWFDDLIETRFMEIDGEGRYVF